MAKDTLLVLSSAQKLQRLTIGSAGDPLAAIGSGALVRHQPAIEFSSVQAVGTCMCWAACCWLLLSQLHDN